MKTPIVQAIDLGYGLVKSTKGHQELICFPSLAVASDPQTMRQLNVRQRNTVDVQVGNALFEVGPDILQAQTGNDVGREIGENWSRSPNYKALMLGALSYMEEDVIDMLVLGLPVNQYLSEERCNELISTYTGTHNVANGKTVEVRNVLVRPQPWGGYISMGDYMTELNELLVSKREFHLKESNIDIGIKPIDTVEQLISEHCVLIVDPGEYTLDWLLVDRGTINTKASGAASDSGRHRVVRDVHRALEQDMGKSIAPANFSRINDSLRTGSALKLGGQIVDLKKYESVVTQSVSDPISRLIEGLRGLEDRIDIILMVGGHPAIYEAEMVRRFPLIPVFLPPQALFANVNGFKSMGVAVASAQA